MYRKPGERLTQVLLIWWLIAFVGAFVGYQVTAATDIGLSAGLSKITAFLGWQAAAAVLALLCAVSSRRLPLDMGLRRLALVPLILLALMLAGFLALVLWANLRNDEPVPVPSLDPVILAPEGGS
jgi:hypothetical protein